MEPLGIIGLVVGIVGAVFAYLQWNHPKAPKASETHPPDNGGTLKHVLERRVLRVGLFRYPPLIDYTETGASVVATGLYAELIQDFANRNSLRVEWCPTKLSDAIPAVTHHEVDCYACIMLSDVRYRECDFVGLLHSIAVIGVVRRGEQSVRHPSDLTNDRNIKIAVCQGEIGHHTASTTLRIPSRRLVEISACDISEIIAQVHAGNASVALADALSCKRMMQTPKAKKNFKLVFADPPILTVPNGFMVAKNDKEFSAWLDAGVRRAFSTVDGRKRDAALHCEFGNSITTY
jgi:membrane-bound lytic murein transglycosylase MltF